ncbi:MAG: RecQ family ATP-dependent DNA helicase [Chitinophagaceae bacterium]
MKEKKNPITSKPFSKANLTKSLRKFFGFTEFKGLQIDAIQSILNKQDTFVLMPTGGGKSLCYQLPALMSEGCAIIISPLIALMKNQVDLVRSYSQNEDIAHFLNSTLNRAQEKKVKEDLLSGKTKMLYVAPETLSKKENFSFFYDLNISFVAVDEAHCISEWGHDFRQEYRKIREVFEEINPSLSFIVLTATATPKVQKDIVKNLGLKKPTIVISSFNRKNLYYEIQPKLSKEQTIKSIVKFISQMQGQSGIIYTLNRKTTEELAEILNINKIKAVAYHAGIESKIRSERQDQFLSEDVQVIVATIAFGMGIDKPDIRFVIHYNLPKSIENYYQETGRAGRDGVYGKCILYYSLKDVYKLEHLIKKKPLTEREITSQLIQEMSSYAESSICRRKVLLHYFGENYKQANCECCDNCLFPKEKVEVKDSIVLVLTAIQQLKENFVAEDIINTLIGKKNSKVQMFDHDKLDCFGKGKDFDETYWSSIIHQCLLKEFLLKNIEHFGILKITEKGIKYLKKPESIKIPINSTFDEGFDEEEIEIEEEYSSVALDENLKKQLLQIRFEQGKKFNLPPYIIFMDTTINDMCTFFPISLEELVTKCHGVSKPKADKYGKPFVEFIAQYLDKNNIIKPDEMFIMKNVADTNTLKFYIIQQIDKKIPLDTIARNKGVTEKEIIDQMISLAISGTKLKIEYLLNEIFDQYDQNDIINYFKTLQTIDLEKAVKELGENDYTLENIKLMWIHFLCKYGI